MFYCEINEDGFCYHVTENPIPLGDNVILSEDNEIGKRYIAGEWLEIEPTKAEEPTLTEQEEAILNTAINTEYLVCLAELGL